ncbi:MAG: glycogen/starch/alpha-glucan phosphorylase [Oscillospiraceae bacterium]|nr:glycogen/starch/alpha-glucan phosphorylase [Oscillospiraceae bacterium]
MELKLERKLKELFDTDLKHACREQVYTALMAVTGEELKDRETFAGRRKLYYVSAEFLIGKLLSNNLINLGLFEEAKEVLGRYGFSLEEMEEQECEPSLGNGGLGRLAACFLDSIAALGLPGDGVGLNYHEGLFRQRFVRGSQREEKDPWITPDGWLRPTGVHFPVRLGEHMVTSTMYDIDVPGWKGGKNTLHLFDLDTVDESIITDGISFDKTDIQRCLTLFLYPDDSDEAGRLLRVYQQYFMVSNTAQLILKELEERGFDPHQLHEHVVVQINDTHPTMIIPELIRLLMERGLTMDEAIREVEQTCAYTNHTILAEALEKWPMRYLEQAAPLIVPIIRELDERIRTRYADPRVQIIDGDERVHMAHIDIHFGCSVNGVAALHTDILKKSELRHFYELYPKKFNNKTNGITFRRWLLHCNEPLKQLVEELIGPDFKDDSSRLQDLLAWRDDPQVLRRLLEVKQEAKEAFRKDLLQHQGIQICTDSVFDVQVKRLHEYKRQQLNVLYAIRKYLDIKAGILPKRPITMIFGAKAAPAYTIAKDIIHLILCMAKLINSDPDVWPWLRIVMIENYNVTRAAKVIPAADISEQISLASKEASGTGNMKFMLNGAVTLGTLDGANVEICQLVGEENIFLFGKSSDQVMKLYETAGYRSRDYYEDPEIMPLVDFICNKRLLAMGDQKSLIRLYQEIVTKDWFMTLLDLKEYIAVKDRMLEAYEDRESWAKMMLTNIAMSGFFSSDRTIAEYNRDIWHL